MKKTVHISVGDLNGIPPEIILRSHAEITTFCQPIYHCHATMMDEAANFLQIPMPPGMVFRELSVPTFIIRPGQLKAESGFYSFQSVESAFWANRENPNEPMVNLPIHKQAWVMTGLPYIGHTEYFREKLGQSVIMLMGWEEFYIALFTDHIPLREVPGRIVLEPLRDFLVGLYTLAEPEKAQVLGLNPHAGDNGLMGKEEEIIVAAIGAANHKIGKTIFTGPLGADSYFIPGNPEFEALTVALYHDQGLIPLKAIQFENTIQISLSRGFIRTSPDHGPGFKIAYQNKKPNCQSYLNAVRYVAFPKVY